MFCFRVCQSFAQIGFDQCATLVHYFLDFSGTKSDFLRIIQKLRTYPSSEHLSGWTANEIKRIFFLRKPFIIFCCSVNLSKSLTMCCSKLVTVHFETLKANLEKIRILKTYVKLSTRPGSGMKNRFMKYWKVQCFTLLVIFFRTGSSFSFSSIASI